MCNILGTGQHTDCARIMCNTVEHGRKRSSCSLLGAIAWSSINTASGVFTGGKTWLGTSSKNYFWLIPAFFSFCHWIVQGSAQTHTAEFVQQKLDLLSHILKETDVKGDEVEGPSIVLEAFAQVVPAVQYVLQQYAKDEHVVSVRIQKEMDNRLKLAY